MEFGPKQLVARLPVTWNDEDDHDDEGISAVPLEMFFGKTMACYDDL